MSVVVGRAGRIIYPFLRRDVQEPVAQVIREWTRECILLHDDPPWLRFYHDAHPCNCLPTYLRYTRSGSAVINDYTMSSSKLLDREVHARYLTYKVGK